MIIKLKCFGKNINFLTFTNQYSSTTHRNSVLVKLQAHRVTGAVTVVFGYLVLVTLQLLWVNMSPTTRRWSFMSRR